MPGPLITRKDIATAAVSSQPRNFDSFGGKARAARVFFYFRTANLPTSMPHALGRTPTSFRVVRLSSGTAAAIDCVTTNASATVTSSGGFGGIGSPPVYVGMAISGAGITGGSTVTAKASDSSITISINATATITPPATTPLTFSGSGQVSPGSLYGPIAPGSSGTTSTDAAYNLTKSHVVLACTTANTWGEIELT